MKTCICDYLLVSVGNIATLFIMGLSTSKLEEQRGAQVTAQDGVGGGKEEGKGEGTAAPGGQCVCSRLLVGNSLCVLYCLTWEKTITTSKHAL